jgi:hypothetical protein
MHPDIEREVAWRGPMTEIPLNLGWTRAFGYEHRHNGFSHPRTSGFICVLIVF